MSFKVKPAVIEWQCARSDCMELQKSPSILFSFKQKISSAIGRLRSTGAFEKDDSLWQYLSVRRTDSMESLANFIEGNMAHFENTNPGPLFPLSEYGNTCFMRGCEEMHIECADKTHSIVIHCDCNPCHPDLRHRHIFKYCDLIDPPTTNRPQEIKTSPVFLDVDAIRRLLILAHPHYPSLSDRTTRSGTVGDNGSGSSSSSSFEIQVRTTTPEENVITTSLLKMKIRRESEDTSELLVQNGRPVWWNSRSGELQEGETHLPNLST